MDEGGLRRLLVSAPHGKPAAGALPDDLVTSTPRRLKVAACMST
jgi:hypothetical protein